MFRSIICQDQIFDYGSGQYTFVYLVRYRDFKVKERILVPRDVGSPPNILPIITSSQKHNLPVAKNVALAYLSWYSRNNSETINRWLYNNKDYLADNFPKIGYEKIYPCVLTQLAQLKKSSVYKRVFGLQQIPFN